jgi:branched-chain amino acid aminotransferase
VNVEPIAFLKDRQVPVRAARVPMFDLGLVGGVAVTEMFRTYRHELFRVEEHLDRLQGSLDAIGLTTPLPMNALRAELAAVVTHNAALIDPADDLGAIVFITAGANATYVGPSAAKSSGPTLGVHTFPLHYSLWREKFMRGVPLAVSSIPAMPASIVDPRAKVRSRLHWHLADRQVQAEFPGATAVLLDDTGQLTETAAANLVVLKRGVLSSPPVGCALEGVSLGMVHDLASQLGFRWERSRLEPGDLIHADEVWLTSTPAGILPAVSIQGRPIGTGTPGPHYERVVEAWSEAVGVKLIDQMQRPDPVNAWEWGE